MPNSRSIPHAEARKMPANGGPDPGELIRLRLAESAATQETIRQNTELVSVISDIAITIIGAYESGHKLLLCGNGGSAADAQHIAAELVGRFYSDRQPLPAISLAANTSTITAVGNDFSFDEVFERQVRALGLPGDILIGLSTSGASENVVRAFNTAQQIGLTTISFTGRSGGHLLDKSDICLRVPSEDTARIQEAHITAAHIVCELVERELG
jgi:D-sedoheptulose 7-phosphate isomerase